MRIALELGWLPSKRGEHGLLSIDREPFAYSSEHSVVPCEREHSHSRCAVAIFGELAARGRTNDDGIGEPGLQRAQRLLERDCG